MRLSDFKAGTILVDICGKVFIHDGYINADGYGVIIGEDSDGMIQKSNCLLYTSPSPRDLN